MMKQVTYLNDEIQEKKSRQGLALAEANKNLSPEERKRRREKAVATRKQHRLEKMVFAESAGKLLKKKFKSKTLDESGNYIEKTVTNLDLVMERLINDAKNPEVDTLTALKVAEFMKETVDGKAVEKKAIVTHNKHEHNVNVTWEEMVDMIHGKKKNYDDAEYDDAEVVDDDDS